MLNLISMLDQLKLANENPKTNTDENITAIMTIYDQIRSDSVSFKVLEQMYNHEYTTEEDLILMLNECANKIEKEMVLL